MLSYVFRYGLWKLAEECRWKLANAGKNELEIAGVNLKGNRVYWLYLTVIRCSAPRSCQRWYRRSAQHRAFQDPGCACTTRYGPLLVAESVSSMGQYVFHVWSSAACLYPCISVAHATPMWEFPTLQTQSWHLWSTLISSNDMHTWTTGWWYTYPSEKWWSSSMGRMTSHIFI